MRVLAHHTVQCAVHGQAKVDRMVVPFARASVGPRRD